MWPTAYLSYKTGNMLTLYNSRSNFLPNSSFVVILVPFLHPKTRRNPYTLCRSFRNNNNNNNNNYYYYYYYNYNSSILIYIILEYPYLDMHRKRTLNLVMEKVDYFLFDSSIFFNDHIYIYIYIFYHKYGF